MAIKIENKSSLNLNFDKLTNHINSVLQSVPLAHLRGITKIMLVDRIEDPRLDAQQRAELPGLYHPKMPGSLPWIEIALETLRSERSWYKRLGRRLTFKANLTATLLSLVGQHYYLTFSHGVKKSKYEAAVRGYVDKQLSVYARTRKGVRATLLRPFRPALEKFARWLRRRYQQEMRKQTAASRPAKRRRRARR